MPAEAAMSAARPGATGVAASLLAAFIQYDECIAVEVPAAKVKLSYKQLLEDAQRWSKKLGPSSNPLVLYMDKTIDFYRLLSCGFLFGYSMCLVDRANPLMRLHRIVEQLDNPRLVTDDPSAAEALNAAGIPTVGVPSAGTRIDSIAGAPPPRDPVPRYFISTSGSTGVPRLVEVRHDATAAFTAWSTRFYRCGPGTRWAQFSSNGFDLSLVDFLTVLSSGGTLVAVTTAWERARPGVFIAEHGITHWHSVPTMIPYLLRGEADLSSLQCLTFCGEPLLRSACAELKMRAPHARLINTYGPTEGTLFCSFHEVSEADLSSTSPVVPIGAPVPEWNFVFIPEGTHHRLVIVGEHLAEGYLNQTSPAFSTANIAGRTIPSFDTGDFFDLTQGAVRFSHRKDGMIKVRGNRVDVGDVVDACVACGVQQSVVMAVGEELVLFLEDPQQVIDQRKLLSDLLERLPAYAIPSRFVAVKQMPRTTNGKIDRKSLTERLDAYE